MLSGAGLSSALPAAPRVTKRGQPIWVRQEAWSGRLRSPSWQRPRVAPRELPAAGTDHDRPTSIPAGRSKQPGLYPPARPIAADRSTRATALARQTRDPCRTGARRADAQRPRHQSGASLRQSPARAAPGEAEADRAKRPRCRHQSPFTAPRRFCADWRGGRDGAAFADLMRQLRAGRKGKGTTPTRRTHPPHCSGGAIDPAALAARTSWTNSER